MGLREDRRRSNQARVVQAALDIFTQKGLAGVTIAGIAQEMNSSVGGLYRYFPNKEAIFVALQIHALEVLSTHVDRILQTIDDLDVPSDQRAKRKLVTVFDLWDRFRCLSPQHYQVLYVFSSSYERKLDDSSASEVDRFVRPIFERIAQAFAECTQEGLMAPGDQLKRTYVMWATLQGLAQFEKRDHLQPKGLTTRALKFEAMKSYLHAWGAEIQTIDEICDLHLADRQWMQ